MKIELPEDVAKIIATLEAAGYEAYAVGGCVRDTILGREPQDWDITTSAKPEQTKSLFRKTIDTGIQHGTVTVLMNHVGYEVTTYRIDGEYEDNRHPKSVEFTDNLILDLERRDFTINAMAYNDKRGIVDAFCGMQDLEAHRIKCVGDAGARFDEDALRILRAVRFSGQLCFDIEPSTRTAAVSRAEHLKHISAERIRVELTKLLTAKDAGKLIEAYHMGMTKVFLAEFDRMMETEQHNPHHIYSVGEHAVRSVEIMNYFMGRFSGKWDADMIPEKTLQLAHELCAMLTKKEQMILCVTMLLHDVGKPDTMTVDEKGIGHFYGHQKEGEKIAGSILKRLTFDNETITLAKHLIYWHDYQYGENLCAMRKTMAKIGKDKMPLLFLVQLSDILAQNPTTFEPKLAKIYRAAELWREVLASKAALELKDLEVTGSDLIREGIETGPQIGRLLHAALEYVLEEPGKNTKKDLLAFVKQQNLTEKSDKS